MAAARGGKLRWWAAAAEEAEEECASQGTQGVYHSVCGGGGDVVTV